MGKPDQMTRRDWLVMTVGVVLLAGGLFALALPVFLNAHDQWGIQVNCGNGYSAQLVQATVTGHVDQCQSALAYRRMWAVAIAGLGTLILVAKVISWLRSGPTKPLDGTEEWHERPDTYLHEAAVLDRRGRPHRERPPGTTL